MEPGAGMEPGGEVGEKLVRDRVPELIRAAGGAPETRVATPAEARRLLQAKLQEEVGELLASDDTEELADVLEVVLALARESGLAPDALEALRARKAAERGGFDRRLVLRFTPEDPAR